MKNIALPTFVAVVMLTMFATWSFRDSIARHLYTNLKILIAFLALAFWNLYDTYRNSYFVDLTRHFDTIRRVLDISYSLKNTESRVMLALIGVTDGEIQHIDGNLLQLLGYHGSERPHNIDEMVCSKIFDVRGFEFRNMNGESISGEFDTDVKRIDGSLIRMSITASRLSDAIIEILFVESDLREIYCETLRSASGANDPLVWSKQITLGEQVNHEEAYVMLLDIMGFTAACAKISSSEVLAWMGRVRKLVDDLLEQHGLQLIETRGDSFLAVTAAPDGPAPASRALYCASAIARSVLAHEATRVRIGIACGPATVARLRCAHSADVLLLFGDVANVAGRLEQSGDAASVHVCGRTAQSFAGEQGMECPPIEVRVPTVTSVAHSTIYDQPHTWQPDIPQRIPLNLTFASHPNKRR
jgi:class 3 adenylate cyclase